MKQKCSRNRRLSAAARFARFSSRVALSTLLIFMMRVSPLVSASRSTYFGSMLRASWRINFHGSVSAFSLQSQREGWCSWIARHSASSRTQHVEANPLWTIRAGFSRSNSSTYNKHIDLDSNSTLHNAYIAVGSNLGDRYQNIASALEMLCDPEWQPEEGVFETVHLVKTSYLHETAPMYMVNQPAFLNGAVQIATDLSPRALLRRIKRVETKLGRDLKAVRNGPRPVDLDIIMYKERNEARNLVPIVLDTPELTIPHAGMSEREFVLKPLCELLSPNAVHPVLNTTMHDLLDRIKRQDYEMRDKDTNDKSASVRVLPLPRGRWLHFNETMIMGILNVTPDSFSDGGNLKGSVDMAVKAAMQMVEDGADIIDIGGESTRPGAEEVRVEEEMLRTIPVIREIRTGQDRKVSDIPISIDTRHAEVARAAVEAGADIVNDVSGGTFDSKMLETVAELRVPIVLMHSRGTPETMQGLTEYDSVVGDVARELLERSRCAEYAGIPRWNQVLDPGIGFAKDLKGNLILLRHMSTLRSLLGDAPILLGTSRKRFIATIANHYLHDKSPEERDYGTVASCIAALCLEGDTSAGCNILRVHNVQGMKQAAMVMDAVKRAK